MNYTKIVMASQACVIKKYKNLKHKIIKCNASMYLKKQCFKFQEFKNLQISKLKTHPLGPNTHNRKHVLTRLIKFVVVDDNTCQF
jgi:predicted ATP-dependent Lon-type protease